VEVGGKVAPSLVGPGVLEGAAVVGLRGMVPVLGLAVGPRLDEEGLEGKGDTLGKEDGVMGFPEGAPDWLPTPVSNTVSFGEGLGVVMEEGEEVSVVGSLGGTFPEFVMLALLVGGAVDVVVGVFEGLVTAAGPENELG
jgi:hypothetical protein